MATLLPFRPLRPAPEIASRVAAVPYDVVNREEAAQLAHGNPLSFLHVSRPEIDLPAEIDPYSPGVYEKARLNFQKLREAAPLVRDQTPGLYVYRLRIADHVQTGIAATFSIDEYDRDLIKKHERTRKEKEDDRTRHVLTLSAQTGPVFLTYRGMDSIQSLVENTVRERPLYDFTAVDGVSHTVWAVGDTAAWMKEFKKVPALYIADGHHRAASASRARAELRAGNPSHSGSEDYNFFLAVAFPAEQLRILPYHRVIKDLNGHSVEELIRLLEKDFEIQRPGAAAPTRGEFSLYLKGQWLGLKPRASRLPHATDVIGSLDVSVLQKAVLEPLLGIQDPRTDKRIDFVGGIRGTSELVRLVDSGQAAAAFSLHPTTTADLMAISDAGEIMPPKSTWFEPKLRDGLLTHLIIS